MAVGIGDLLVHHLEEFKKERQNSNKEECKRVRPVILII